MRSQSWPNEYTDFLSNKYYVHVNTHANLIDVYVFLKLVLYS